MLSPAQPCPAGRPHRHWPRRRPGSGRTSPPGRQAARESVGQTSGAIPPITTMPFNSRPMRISPRAQSRPISLGWKRGSMDGMAASSCQVRTHWLRASGPWLRAAKNPHGLLISVTGCPCMSVTTIITPKMSAKASWINWVHVAGRRSPSVKSPFCARADACEVGAARSLPTACPAMRLCRASVRSRAWKTATACRHESPANDHSRPCDRWWCDRLEAGLELGWWSTDQASTRPGNILWESDLSCSLCRNVVNIITQSAI